MVRLTDVHFAYPKKKPLFDAVTFTVEPGGIVGLLGKNGSGKTTLLKLSAGLLFAQGGTATLFDVPSEHRLPSVLSRIAFVPEQFEVPSIRMRRFIQSLAGYYPRFDEQFMERCLQRFEIVGSERLNELSHGQQKKVLLSFALATMAEVVILDEPTNGLDIPSKRIFRQLTAEAAGDDRALIISTHQVRDVENLIDPIVVLDEGKVVFQAGMDRIQDAVEMRRFDTEVAAGRAGAFAMDTHLGSSVALVRRDADGGEPVGGNLDLELLFQAAVTNPEALSSACGGAV